MQDQSAFEAEIERLIASRCWRDKTNLEIDKDIRTINRVAANVFANEVLPLRMFLGPSSGSTMGGCIPTRPLTWAALAPAILLSGESSDSGDDGDD